MNADEHRGFTSMEVLAILNDTPLPEGSQWVRAPVPSGEVETPSPPIVFGPDLGTPPWADGVPNIHAYVESEIAVAGALSTMPPFDVYHPTYALPFARAALDALSTWEPTDG